MNLDKELTLEIAKNKADEIIVMKELDLAKKQLIDDLNGGLGEELKKGSLNKPIKIKKPFFSKIREFFQRINRTLGN